MSIKYGAIDITDIPNTAKVYHGLDLVYEGFVISWEMVESGAISKTVKATVPINKTIYIEFDKNTVLTVTDLEGDIETKQISDAPAIYSFVSRKDEVTITFFKSANIVKIKVGQSTMASDDLIAEINPVEKNVIIITEELKNDLIAWNMYDDIKDTGYVVVVNTGDKIKVTSTTEARFLALKDTFEGGETQYIGGDVKEVEFEILNPDEYVGISNTDEGIYDLGLKIYKVN